MSNMPDDELNRLLSELSNVDPLNFDNDEDDDTDEVIMPPKPRAEPMIDVSITPEPLAFTPQIESSHSKDLPSVFSEQLRKVASQYSSVFEEIIKNYKSDREQAQEVINYFLDTIAAGGKVPRVYLEKVADAVRAKNEIAQTAIKALDSLPKLISATKGNDIFNNNVGISFDASNLREILELAEKKEKEEGK